MTVARCAEEYALMGDDRVPGIGAVEAEHWVCPRAKCAEDDYGTSAPRCTEHGDLMIPAFDLE